jgi:hypothetical protein
MLSDLGPGIYTASQEETAGQVAGARQRTIYGGCQAEWRRGAKGLLRVFGVLRGNNGCRAQREPTEASCRPPVDGATCVGGFSWTQHKATRLPGTLLNTVGRSRHAKVVLLVFAVKPSMASCVRV